MKISKNNLIPVYGNAKEVVEEQLTRFEILGRKFVDKFDTDFQYCFSSPGRTEIAGNHTDHNHGRVIAASIDLDTIAVVAPSKNNIITLYSDGYDDYWAVDITDLKMKEEEKGTTASLIRGIAARFSELGFIIGGFNVFISSDVMIGSGLSSSASFEVLIGTILNSLFNKNRIDPVTIAKAGQFAENNYFGKPCGLMDQVACAVGGVVTIDFENPADPVVKKIAFYNHEYSLVVVDTGANHADLTDDYAAIPEEMKKVAESFGAEVCRSINFENIKENINQLRNGVGDRAILRAIHFINENERVDKIISALANDTFDKFLSLIKESGNSSFKWLQNCYSVNNVKEQGLALALALTEQFLIDSDYGVCRVHGGGFAGTIQVFIRKDLADDYIEFIEPFFGKGCVVRLNIRDEGAVQII